MTHAYSICSELPADGGVPSEIQIFPNGPQIVGRDGRSWRLDDPEALIAEFQREGRPLPVDWEHSSQHRAAQGLDAPAAGWITQLVNRAGAVWAKVEWTERARQQIAAREYRFISPAFLFHQATGAIRKLVHAGLTNQPNLSMAALNQVSTALPTLTAMELEICRATGKDPTLFALELAQHEQQQAALNQSSPPEREQIIDQIARATGKDPAALKAEIARQTSEGG